MKKIILATSILVLTACGETQFTAMPDVASTNIEQGAKDSTTPMCQIQYYDYAVDTKVVSYEFKDKFGVSFGFNLVNNFIKALGLDINISNSQLTVNMAASVITDQPGATFTTVTGGAIGKDIGLNGDIDISQISVGASFYETTGVNKLTTAGLQNTFAALMKRLTTREAQTPWMTRVLNVFPGQNVVAIQAGLRAGVRIGDQFNVQNTVQKYEIGDCGGNFEGEMPAVPAVSAVLEVIDVQNDYALLKVNSAKVKAGDFNAGAKVTIASLPLAKGEKKRAVLGRSVYLRSVDAGKLLINGATDVDVRGYAQSALPALVSPETTSNRYYYYQHQL